MRNRLQRSGSKATGERGKVEEKSPLSVSRSTASTSPQAPLDPHLATPADIIALQRTHGNQFVQRFLAGRGATPTPVTPQSGQTIQRKGAGKRLRQVLAHLKATDPERYARYSAILDNLSAQDQARIGAAIGSGSSGGCMGPSKSDRMDTRVTKLGNEVHKESLKNTAEIIPDIPGLNEEDARRFVKDFQNLNSIAYGLSGGVPSLKNDEFWVTYPPQDTMNCLAYAVGESKKGAIWVDEADKDVRKNDWDYSFPVFDSILSQYGFAPAPKGLPPVETHIPIGAVVGYGKSEGELHHFAKRVPGGFESKLGPNIGVFHATLAQVTSGENGYPQRLYVRSGMEVGKPDYDSSEI